MQAVAKGLVGLAAFSFILAVLTAAVTGPIMNVAPESFARAANNLLLLAIAIFIGFKDDGGV